MICNWMFDECAACRQMKTPVFPVHMSNTAAGAHSSHIQHPSPMRTPYQPQCLSVAADNAAPAQAPLLGFNEAAVHHGRWNPSTVIANPGRSENLTAGPRPQGHILPSGFVPLQPVSTTEVSTTRKHYTIDAQTFHTHARNRKNANSLNPVQ